MPNVTAKGAWQAPLRQLTVIVHSRGAGKTTFSVQWRTADRGDLKAIQATLADGDWPKDIRSKEDAIKALINVVIALERSFLKPKE